ncbi:MAG: hypothetical protein P8P49_02330 [Opitutales bacterium]|nr:hypothetical protein [Opitutales bacterium]
MNRSYNKVLFVCFASLICQGSVGASEFITLRSLDVMDSITWISPIRNIEEDGSMIVRITSNQTAIPLFYSKNVPLFDFMDRSGPQFYTLEQLSLNPRLVPRPVFTNRNQKQAAKEPSIVEDRKVKNLENRLRDLEAKLLESETKQSHRPGDDELQAFILEGNEHLSAEQRIEYLSRVISEAKKRTDRVDSPIAEYSTPLATNLLAQKEELPNADFLSLPLPPTMAESENQYPLQRYNKKFAKSVLKFKASVPTPQGTERPAQASDFYLTTRNLQDLLSDLNLERALAGEVKSVAELWAHAEKDSSANPEIALGVKSILLQAKVGKARTDPFGNGELDDVSPDDKYFLIGIDKDDQTGVVTIWSKHVEVGLGENMVELTTKDVIYHE